MTFLIMLAVLLGGCLVAGWMVTHWRKAFVFLFPLIYVEDVIRKAFVPGQHIWPQFLRDGIVLCLYAAMIFFFMRPKNDGSRVHPIYVAYLVVLYVILAASLNPNINASVGQNYWALPLLGIRYWVFYVPMAYVAYRWLVDFKQLIALGKLLSVCITFATILGCYELSFYYMNEEVPFWLGPVGEQMRIGDNTRGLDKTLGQGTMLVFAYGVFATTSKYSVQSLFALALLGGLVCWTRGHRYKFGSLMALFSIVLSRGRSVMIGFLLFAGLSTLLGALKNSHVLSVKLLRKYVYYCFSGACFVGVLGFLYFTDVAAVLLHFVSELGDHEAMKMRYQVHFAGVVDNLVQFRDVLGYGTGMGAHGTEWVTGRPPVGITEGGFGTPYIDFGLWGWIVYMIFMFTCIKSCIKTCWHLRYQHLFPMAFLLTGFYCGVWGYWLKSRQLFGDSSVQLVLWIALGLVYGLKKLSDEASQSDLNGTGGAGN